MKKPLALLLAPLLLLTTHQLLAKSDHRSFVTFADARNDGGIAQSSDGGDGEDSPGDIFVFDQKLLSEDTQTVIGRNAGFCIRTDPGAPDFSSTDHPTLPDDPDNNYGQCTWTLSFNENSGYSGSLTVSGREADLGTSEVAIIGGTGDFIGTTGVMMSTPFPQDGNGVLYRQEIVISKRHKR